MQKIKSFILTVSIPFLGVLSLTAQSGTVASGGEATGAGGTVSYSIGQIDYISPQGANGNTNEGLQQPYEFFTVGVNENESISLELSVYPNPTFTYLTLNVDLENIDGLFYQLYDMNGKVLSTQNITEKINTIPMEELTPATYFLKISNSQQEIKTFKIIKK